MRRRLPVAALVVVLPLLTWVLASGQDVAHLLADARYEEARALLAAAPEPPVTPADRFGAARLATDPGTALVHLEGVPETATDRERDALLLDRAGILFGSGRYRDVVATLGPLVTGSAADRVGQAELLAGLALRALGDATSAERMFASVKPQDPAFAAARIALGDLSLVKGDAHLALRYYDAAVEAGGARAHAGRWRAQRLLGEDAEATALLRELHRDQDGGVALLEIRRQQHADADAETARRPPADPVAVAPAAPAGRYALQLGAYRDRGLALEVVRRYSPRVPDLRIDEERDPRGQILYKVRTGAFVNPARARTEASRLARDLDLDVFVAELGR